ncbi:hypothetical protein [Maribellus mangrovi]|uniref:hypothetical protein n=1 Tax=Maribellus mangrovi TaxID=3133146 RepID=UPI0030EDFC83
MKCPTGKVKFADQVAAEFYLAKLKKTSCRAVVPQRAYLCEYCNTWHLTSEPESPKQIDPQVVGFFITIPKEKWERKLRWIKKYQEKIREQKRVITDLMAQNKKLKQKVNSK